MTNDRTLNSVQNINSNFIEHHVDQDVFQTAWGWWHAGAAIGVAGGILATVIGLLLSVISWFAGHEIAVSPEGQVGTWLIIGTFPLMMFGAYSLDKIDTANKARQRAYSKKFGLTNTYVRK